MQKRGLAPVQTKPAKVLASVCHREESIRPACLRRPGDEVERLDRNQAALAA